MKGPGFTPHPSSMHSDDEDEDDEQVVLQEVDEGVGHDSVEEDETHLRLLEQDLAQRPSSKSPIQGAKQHASLNKIYTQKAAWARNMIMKIGLATAPPLYRNPVYQATAREIKNTTLARTWKTTATMGFTKEVMASSDKNKLTPSVTYTMVSAPRPSPTISSIFVDGSRGKNANNVEPTNQYDQKVVGCGIGLIFTENATRIC